MTTRILWIALVGCGGGKTDATDTATTDAADADTDTDSDSDTDADADSDADADADSDADTDTAVPCAPDGVCELSVGDAGTQCGNGGGASLSVSVLGAGSIRVQDVAYAQGCCPDFAVTAQLDVATGLIEPVYTLSNDFCDCICMLDAAYSLGDIPAGSWTVRVPTGLEELVTVP